MSDSSDTTSRSGEKTAYLSTWVRPEVKDRVQQRAEESEQTVAEYLRRLVREDRTAATT